MSVRKRTWKGPGGELKEAWVVDYVDQDGERHIKTFAKKRDADAEHAIVGGHRPGRRRTPPTARASSSRRPASCGSKAARRPRLERTTLDRTTGSTSSCTSSRILGDAAALATDGAAGARLSRTGCAGTDARRPWCARPAARSARVLADAQERGRVSRNVVREMKGRAEGVGEGQAAPPATASSRSGSISRHPTRFARSRP